MDHSQIQSICLAEVRFFFVISLNPLLPTKKMFDVGGHPHTQENVRIV
jgi:hypothetical protein